MKCQHDPKETKGAIGMYHCPECGDMVLAGVEHGDMDKACEVYGRHCDAQYEELRKYLLKKMSVHHAHNIIHFMEVDENAKSALMEIWLRAGIYKEDRGDIF